MDFRKQKLSIEEVKSTDMVNYLSSIGYEPAKIRSNDYWYLSTLRHEKTPSFKVSRKLNRWHGHGVGKGGSLIDFAMLYHGYNLCEFLDVISVGPSFQKPITDRSEKAAEHENRIKVLGDFQITSFVLLRYLEQRHIAIDIAETYCREVRYELNEKVCYGIGFKNDSGGFDIRNPYVKASSSPKDNTTYKNGSDEAVVFEGFFDFLSFKTVCKNLTVSNLDVVVLNTLSFFEKARPFMEQHRSICLYLDRDEHHLQFIPLNADKSKFKNNMSAPKVQLYPQKVDFMKIVRTFFTQQHEVSQEKIKK